MARYGFRTAGFRNGRLEQALDAIAGAGYEYVELCLEYHGLVDLDARAMRRVVSEAQSRNLEVCSFSYHGDGQLPDQRWAGMARSLDLAASCGIPILVVNGDRPDEDITEQRLENFIFRLGGLVPKAIEGNVLLAVEPEPLLSVANTTDMLRVLDSLPSPPVAVNLDIGHAFLTDALDETFRSLGKHIVHLHLEDMRTGVHKHLLPGDGDIDFAAIAALAAAIDFDGPWVIDLFSADADPLFYCREALSRLRHELG